jgi:hypothetical protein
MPSKKERYFYLTVFQRSITDENQKYYSTTSTQNPTQILSISYDRYI